MRSRRRIGGSHDRIATPRDERPADIPDAAIAVSVVIPTLNEAANIGWVLDRMPERVDEVIIVDGRSLDDTVGAALRARPDARIVYEPRPGKGAALRAGFFQARGDVIVMLDADGSMHPGEITRFVDRLEDGYHLVKGSRFLSNGGTADISRLRALGNLGLLTLANRLCGCGFTELCYGFMAFWRSVLPALALTADGFEIETQIVVNALRRGLRVAEVPSFEAARRQGRSNLHTFRDGGRVLREVTLARRRPRAVPPQPAIVEWSPPAHAPFPLDPSSPVLAVALAPSAASDASAPAHAPLADAVTSAEPWRHRAC